MSAHNQKARNYFLSLLVMLCLSFFVSFDLFAQPNAPELGEKEVKAIDIMGNKTASMATLLSKIKTRVGDKYSVNVARDDIKRLYSLGYFDDVRIELESVDGKVKVIFVVAEKPIVEGIVFKGIRRLSKSIVEEAMKTKKGFYLDKQKLRSDLDEIRRVYGRKGYSDTEASYELSLDEANNKVTVTIQISEGLSSRIKKVSVEGNKTFSSAKIISLIKGKPAAWWLFRKGYLDETVLNEDVDRVQSFYRSEGFSDCKVEQKIVKLRPGFYKIVLKIDEGKRYYVGEVTIYGNEAFASQDIKKHLKQIISGYVFSQAALDNDKFNIRSFYMDNGYIFAKVDTSNALNQQTGLVDVSFKLTENEIVYIKFIKIKGNVKTKDLVIRRELRLKPGDRFNGDKLRRSKERLYNLGFFDEQEGIDFDIEPTEKKNESNLVVQVKETQTGSFSFGGGYSTVDQFIGFIELEQKNFDWNNFPYFTGGGQDLRFRASVGNITNNFELSFTEPWMFDYPVSFGFDVFKRRHDRDTDVGYGYNEIRTGGDLRLGREFSDYWRADSFYRIEQVKISDIDTSAGTDFLKEEGTNDLNTLGLSATFDSRDNVFEPHKGLVFYNSFECTGGPFGGDKNFTKLWNTSTYYLSMPKDSVTVFQFRAGAANPFKSSSEVPIYERFYAGGADTIRGYRERKVGPIDTITDDPIGGESVLIGNIEYLYPVWKYVKAAAFIDSGNVWSKVDDIGQGGFKTGIGLGVRVRTPFGPFKLDYGFPLNKEPGETRKRSGQIHFSFSKGF
jgi:outer membrane protein insertion porin family